MRPLLVCNNGQGIVGVTLSHEFTHFIQEWSPEKFKVLGDYVIRRFNESNVNVDALVRTQMEKAKRARGEVLSYDAAYAEVVADSMEQMFTGEKSQALEQLAELKKQDATLWGKIKEWFKRIIPIRFKAIWNTTKSFTQKKKASCQEVQAVKWPSH